MSTFASACTLATRTAQGAVRHACCRWEMVAATSGLLSACIKAPYVQGLILVTAGGDAAAGYNTQAVHMLLS